MAAVQLYVMEWETEPLCKLLNKALKSDRQDELKPWLPYLQLFRAGVERLPSFKGVCWRGTNKNIGSKFTRGQTVIWQGISSCSKSLDFILKYCVGTSGTLVKIDTINGKDFSNHTLDFMAEEVILMPGATLIVKRVGQCPDKSSSSSSSSKHDTNQISSMKSTDEYKETQASPKSKFDDNQNVAHASAST
ncbi:unnamed protein product [Rotaria sp. Silwood1]|nr:unnamed protein product [Rotaria sp. Silwood1]